MRGLKILTSELVIKFGIIDAGGNSQVKKHEETHLHREEELVVVFEPAGGVELLEQVRANRGHDLREGGAALADRRANPLQAEVVAERVVSPSQEPRGQLRREPPGPCVLH